MELGALVGGRAEVIGSEATIEEAAAAMVEAGIDALAVISGRNLAGIITERDLIRVIGEDADPTEELVEDWMTESPDTFTPDVDVTEAAAWMLETGYRHMPVMDDGELAGIASIRDVLWAMVEGS